jgi:hypothetical protein
MIGCKRSSRFLTVRLKILCWILSARTLMLSSEPLTYLDDFSYEDLCQPGQVCGRPILVWKGAVEHISVELRCQARSSRGKIARSGAHLFYGFGGDHD